LKELDNNKLKETIADNRLKKFYKRESRFKRMKYELIRNENLTKESEIRSREFDCII
jgi:hypothetical protein